MLRTSFSRTVFPTPLSPVSIRLFSDLPSRTRPKSTLACSRIGARPASSGGGEPAPHLVSKVTQRMVSVFDPQAIYLFGSRAWGQPTEDSDVDLLVVVKSSDDPPWTRASKGFAQLRGVGVGCDLIVKTEAEVQAEGRFASSLMAKILRDGKKVYVSPK